MITLWEDRSAADALNASSSYRNVVAEIMSRGFLHGGQTMEIGNVHLRA